MHTLEHTIEPQDHESLENRPSSPNDLIDRIAATICAQHCAPSWQSGSSPEIALPSVAEVTRILARLEEVFFPCFRSRNCRAHKDADSLVRRNLRWLYPALVSQVERAIPFRWLGDYAVSRGVIPCADIRAAAEDVVRRFFDSLPAIREKLMLDVEAAYCGDPAALSYAEVILSYPGLRAITVHRIAHEIYSLNVPLLPRIMSEHIHACTGIDVHPGARIAPSFFIDHGTGVVIGETTVIGARVKLFQGVTLGARSFPVDEDGNLVKGIKRHPTLGDGVIIYAGATVLGDIHIGDYSEIGGNVWLIESVEPHSIVRQESHRHVKVTRRSRT